jgi:hypothetical protein
VITVETWKYRNAYVRRDGRVIALMERSPWSGEWCYGARVDEHDGTFSRFLPPFTPTGYRTPLAAAKAAARAIEGAS